MSLDVYLDLPGSRATEAKERIFVRENGRMREISRGEWNRRHPELEPVTCQCNESDRVYSANITHNLGAMAKEAGIYKHLWRPEELGITKAGQLIEPLTAGLTLLRSDPEHFLAYNPENGWGDYEGLVDFVAKYLAACEEYPQADVSVWR